MAQQQQQQQQQQQFVTKQQQEQVPPPQQEAMPKQQPKKKALTPGKQRKQQQRRQRIQQLLQKLEGQPPFPFLQLPHAIMTAVASKLHREDAWKFAKLLQRAHPAAAAAVRSSITNWQVFAGMKKASRQLDVPAYVTQLAALQQLSAQVHIRGTEQHRTGEPAACGAKSLIYSLFCLSKGFKLACCSRLLLAAM
jgi:hypothetical protein